MTDPYNNSPIIILNRNFIKSVEDYNIILVPYDTVNNHGMLECIRGEKIEIIGIGECKDFLIGLSENIKIDGIDCILNERIMEG